MPLFCDKCGFENKDSANFCKGCGARMEDEEISKTVVASPQIPPGYNADPSYTPTQCVNIPQSHQPPPAYIPVEPSRTMTERVIIPQIPVEPSRTMTERVTITQIPVEQTYPVPSVPAFQQSHNISGKGDSNKKILFFTCTGVVLLFLLVVFFRSNLFNKESSSSPEPTHISSVRKTPVAFEEPTKKPQKPSYTKVPELKIP